MLNIYNLLVLNDVNQIDFQVYDQLHRKIYYHIFNLFDKYTYILQSYVRLSKFSESKTYKFSSSHKCETIAIVDLSMFMLVQLSLNIFLYIMICVSFLVIEDCAAQNTSGRFEMSWPKTKPDNRRAYRCPGDERRSPSFISRYCDQNGIWQRVDTSLCPSPKILRIINEVRKYYIFIKSKIFAAHGCSHHLH